jgi:hypothetical protein
MEKNVLQIGQRVERIGSLKDYTTGRKGEVVEIAETRVRVRWTEERDGSKVFQGAVEPKICKGVRTWVAIKTVKAI